jgi:hypothetical protein
MGSTVRIERTTTKIEKVYNDDWEFSVRIQGATVRIEGVYSED